MTDGVLVPATTAARFTSRSTNRPDIAGYRVNAVVDWIDVEFTVPRVRSVYSLRRDLDASRVTEMTAGGKRGTSFCARVQDPARAYELALTLAGADARDIRVTSIEIAVDFYPKSAGATESMPTLGAHLLRGLKNPMDFARFGKAGPGVDQINSFASTVRHFNAGHTCYLGHRRNAHQQRLYVKRTNNGGKPLPVDEHRVRVENTYASTEGFADVMYGSMVGLVGRDDFSFRRMIAPTTTVTALVIGQVAQAGTRFLRKDRTVFDKRTEADTELNRRVYDALRSLRTRWASKPKVAEIAGQVLVIPLGEGAQSNNYTSLITDFHTPTGSEASKGEDEVVIQTGHPDLDSDVTVLSLEEQKERGKEEGEEGTSIERSIDLVSPYAAGDDRSEILDLALSAPLAPVISTFRSNTALTRIPQEESMLYRVGKMISTLPGLVSEARMKVSSVARKCLTVLSSLPSPGSRLASQVLSTLGIHTQSKPFDPSFAVHMYTRQVGTKIGLHALPTFIF